MEGILLDLGTAVSPWNVIGALNALAFAAGTILLGYTADEEEAGRRLFWAEWPLPESEEAPGGGEFRMAA
jgi:hypothetical protein